MTMLTTHKELEFTRKYIASRETVFDCWTQPKHVARWWGPHHFTNPVCNWDARPEGKLYIEMMDPEGTKYPMSGVFRVVTPPELLIFVASVNGPSGKLALEVLTTLKLSEENGVTTQHLHLRVITATDEAEPMLVGMQEGWKQSLERLESHVESL